jgi:hypothetical protein
MKSTEVLNPILSHNLSLNLDVNLRDVDNNWGQNNSGQGKIQQSDQACSNQKEPAFQRVFIDFCYVVLVYDK